MAELRVADYFPRVLPPCKEAAAPFFTCFSDRSAQRDGAGGDAAQRALQECAKFMEGYDACMREQLPLAKKREIYRVPDAYRTIVPN